MRSVLNCGLVLLAAAALAGTAEKPPPKKGPPRLEAILAGEAAPASVAELKAMEARFREVAARVVPCTVGLQMGGGSGSGVIVSAEGLVLTAGHVVGRAGREVAVILHDGRRVKGKTLGANFSIDSGMVQITDKGPWPFVEVGESKAVALGAWCLATGHPSGYQAGRTPPVRVGRVVAKHSRGLVTDCMLVGGDSGGPLFDTAGKVVGIHSRIGGSLISNVHVPADTYRETWDRLAKGETWGGAAGPQRGGPYVGVVADPHSEQAKVMAVQEGAPAEKAGIQPGDVIVKFDGKGVKSFEELAKAVRAKKPGNQVKVELERGDETLTVELTIGRYGGPQQ